MFRKKIIKRPMKALPSSVRFSSHFSSFSTCTSSSFSRCRQFPDWILTTAFVNLCESLTTVFVPLKYDSSTIILSESLSNKLMPVDMQFTAWLSFIFFFCSKTVIEFNLASLTFAEAISYVGANGWIKCRAVF